MAAGEPEPLQGLMEAGDFRATCLYHSPFRKEPGATDAHREIKREKYERKRQGTELIQVLKRHFFCLLVKLISINGHFF